MKNSQIPSDCGNYPDDEEIFGKNPSGRVDSLSENIKTQEQGDQFMKALRSLTPKVLVSGYCSYSNSTIFLDQDWKYITDVHENDGEWRDEYFGPILKHFEIESVTVDFDKLLEEFAEKLEDCGMYPSEIDYRAVNPKWKNITEKLLKKK
jgi:hypothetical protein